MAKVINGFRCIFETDPELERKICSGFKEMLTEVLLKLFFIFEFSGNGRVLSRNMVTSVDWLS